MKVVQINLHHSKVASDNLKLLLMEGQLDLALIQEPWILNNRVMGLGSTNYNVYYSDVAGKVRTCIVAKKGLHILMQSHFSSGDLTVVEVRGINESCVVASAYLPYDDGINIPSEALRSLISASQKGKKNLVLGCDANAHHTLWGSTDINPRGEVLFNFILESNLVVCNRGNDPTFVTSNRREVLDITFVSEHSAVEVTNWRVSSKASLSDHCWILFELQLTTRGRGTFRNPRRANWSKFRRELRKSGEPHSTEDLTSAEAVDNAVDALTGLLARSFERSCPVSRYSGKKRPPWWSDKIGELIRISRVGWNLAKEGVIEWYTYKESVKILKREIRFAKRNSWRLFCESMESTNEASRLRKILAKTPTPASNIRNSDGTWSETHEETLDILLSTHFPGCATTSGDGLSILEETSGINADDVGKIVDDYKIAWAIICYHLLRTRHQEFITFDL